MAPLGVLRLRHCLPDRLRLKVSGASDREARTLARGLGGEWHGWSGCLVLHQPPPLSALAAELEALGWWLEAPAPAPWTRAAAETDSPWEQLTLEVGASLIGASLGEPTGRWLGSGLAGPAGAAVGSFLGLVVGAVLATEVLHLQHQPDSDLGQELERELGKAGGRVGTKVASRLGEEAGALAGLQLGGLLGGPVGASAGALLGTLVVGQLGEDAALHHTEQWRHPWRWLRQTGRTAAGEAASQSLFGLLGGALLQAPGRRAGERLGLYLGRRIDWQRLRPLSQSRIGLQGSAQVQQGSMLNWQSGV